MANLIESDEASTLLERPACNPYFHDGHVHSHRVVRSVTPTPSSSSSSAAAPVHLSGQQSFLLHMKICFLYIARTTQTDTTSLRSRIRELVTHCTAENRRGNPDYRPLSVVVKRKLRRLLGSVHWNKTRHLLTRFCEARNITLSE